MPHVSVVADTLLLASGISVSVPDAHVAQCALDLDATPAVA